MKKTIVLFGFLTLFVGIKDVHPQTKRNINAIDKTIAEYFNVSSIKGMSVSIVDRDGFLLSKGYGQNLGNEVTPQTPLFIGSVTKVITSLATTLLIEQGKLKFTDNLKMYFDDCPGPLENITIRNLLHHHSGITQQSGYNKELEYKGNLIGIKTELVPGEKGIYSSANSMLLGMIIEKVSGLPYGRFVEEQIFQPLNMVDSYVPTPKESTDIEGYTFAYGPVLRTRQMDYGSFVIPAGYVISTTNDLGKFCQMFLNNGQIITNGIETTYLKKETIKDIFTPFKVGEFGYGMAWGIGKIENEKAYSHEGMTKISSANVVILPDEGIAIACIVNANSGPFSSLTSEVISGIINEVNESPKKTIYPKEVLIRILFGLLLLKVIYQVIKDFLKWKDEGFPTKIRKASFSTIRRSILRVIPFLVLIAIPKLVDVPLSMFLRIMPDLGISLLVGGILSIILGYFTLVLGKEKKYDSEPFK